MINPAEKKVVFPWRRSESCYRSHYLDPSCPTARIGTFILSGLGGLSTPLHLKITSVGVTSEGQVAPRATQFSWN